jgi:hypothetical protein
MAVGGGESGTPRTRTCPVDRDFETVNVDERRDEETECDYATVARARRFMSAHVKGTR